MVGRSRAAPKFSAGWRGGQTIDGASQSNPKLTSPLNWLEPLESKVTGTVGECAKAWGDQDGAGLRDEGDKMMVWWRKKWKINGWRCDKMIWGLKTVLWFRSGLEGEAWPVILRCEGWRIGDCKVGCTMGRRRETEDRRLGSGGRWIVACDGFEEGWGEHFLEKG